MIAPIDMKPKKVKFKDETERILANKYLTDKLNQANKEMEEGKGVTVSIKDLWKYLM